MMLPDLVARSRVWFTRPAGFLLGDQEARLLEAIERVGSIKDGAEAAAMSYRTAWSRVRQMERILGKPVVRSRAGGPGGGATTLTDEARALLRLFRDLDRGMAEHLAQEFARVTKVRT